MKVAQVAFSRENVGTHVCPDILIIPRATKVFPKSENLPTICLYQKKVTLPDKYS